MYCLVYSCWLGLFMCLKHYSSDQQLSVCLQEHLHSREVSFLVLLLQGIEVMAGQHKLIRLKILSTGLQGTLKLKRVMPNSHCYPLNFPLSKNYEFILFFFCLSTIFKLDLNSAVQKFRYFFNQKFKVCVIITIPLFTLLNS